MKAKDIIYRSLNGIAAVANGYALAHSGAPGERYAIAKGIALGCDFLSCAILRVHNMAVHVKMDELKEPHKASSLMKFTTHELCMATMIFDGFRTVFGGALEFAAERNAICMTAETANVFAGVDPLKKQYLLEKKI